MASVAAIHDALRDVDASASNVGLFVQISDFINWATVNSHADLQFGMLLEFFANFQRAKDRGFRAGAKN